MKHNQNQEFRIGEEEESSHGEEEKFKDLVPVSSL